MTYPPQPEPFAEALGEAAQTAAMAYRLVLAITDAVRRATQKRITGREEELGEDAAKVAPGWSTDQLRGVLGDDILAELMAGADWPQLARQLVGLQQAGVEWSRCSRRPPRRSRARPCCGRVWLMSRRRTTPAASADIRPSGPGRVSPDWGPRASSGLPHPSASPPR
ncbi:hypothetical protein AB0D45_31270 [Streptomyces sp. NPDC048352]|uniref:hypothetical protein n=1 Tax=Streptomyces sp. NPDC048352 TaxID=3154718 RepID=UPI003449C5DF